MDATVARLQQELSRLRGPARVPVLKRLAQEFCKQYLRIGPGSLPGLVPLSAAIESLDEAYLLLNPAHPARGALGGQLGWLLYARSGTHGSDAVDRERAIVLISAAVSSDQPSMVAAGMRMALASLHLDRAMQAGSAAAGNPPGRSTSSPRADLDEAIRQLREVRDGGPANAEVMSAARIMLDFAESMRPLVWGDQASFDSTRANNALAAMQQLQQQSFPMPAMLTFPMDLDQVDPLDYPVYDMPTDSETAPTIPQLRPAPTPRTQSDPEASRRGARRRLAELVGDAGNPRWMQAIALLVAGPEQLPAGDLDMFVGAAANAVGEGEDGDPVESGLDCLVSAVGLCLRERRDGSGWGDGTVSGGYRAVAELLLAAATRIPADHPAAAVIVEAVGGLLDEARPLAGAIVEIAGPIGEYAAASPRQSAVAVAIGQLCRTVAALNVGAEIDSDQLATAVAAVPVDHAWRGVLATAAGQARLISAVRAGDAVAVDRDPGSVAPDPDGLVPLLQALLRDDVPALRVAIDGLAGCARTPRIAAVLGAGYLTSAICASVREPDDLACAIQLLSASAQALDNAWQRLRTRTWWRLAEAYRRRGGAGDIELSRDAGLVALRDGGLDRRSAARFAGWLLADGHGVQAYTALEIAAAGAGPPESCSLAEDVLDLILGIAPEAARPPEVPQWTDVATAVRTAGASALLYLHPTDEAGRRAGVLCLEPGGNQPEVLANVPVTDPLASDDPGWSAILGRWRGGCLLVAATGELRRIALPAVCTEAGRRLAQDVSLGYVSSGKQLIDLAERERSPAERAPLFVVNPRGDRDAEMADVLALRRLFYPRSVCVGRALESVDERGSREGVLDRLAGTSLLHLACGLRGKQLELARGEVLDVTSMRGTGLVLLAEPGTDGFGPTAEAFIGAGFSGVIGWQWPVPAPFAALALFMTHLMLVDHRLVPASAVAMVQQWMLDLDRDLPPLLPNSHRHTVETTDLTRPSLWAALAYHGC